MILLKKSMHEAEKQNARRGLMIYFAVLIAASAFVEGKILQTGESIDKARLLILTLMYTPAAASSPHD